MNEAVDLKGTKLIVLTEEEYSDLIEDAADIVAALEARDKGGPGMRSEYVLASIDGTMHPLMAWRLSADLTQADLAAKAGLPEATVREIEAREGDPRLSEIKALAAALNLDIGAIVD